MAVRYGSDSNDFLTGTDGADTIYGYAGIDDIDGGKGNDLLLGGDGNDDIDGGDGNNTIDGGAGNDNLSGRMGSDSIVGGAGDDGLTGNGGDTLRGGDGHDFIYSSGGNRVYGGAGNDTYAGGAGLDLVYGEGGNDVFFVANFDNSGLPTFTGGAGSDLYILRDYHGFYERVRVITDFAPGLGGDRIDLDEILVRSGERYGYAGGNPFNSSIDLLRLVQSGADTLLQWHVDEPTLTGDQGWNTIFRLKNVSPSSLTAANFVGGIPPDGSPVPGETLGGGATADTLEGGFFNDTIEGFDGDDLLSGRGGNDSILGGLGNDTLTGGAGNDRLLGDAGDDLFIVDSTGTASVATGGDGVDTYRLEIGFLKLNRGYTVTDFTAGPGGDRIDVTPLLVHSSLPYGSTPWTFAYTGGNPFANGFLRWVPSGTNVHLQWDSDGVGDTRAGWQTVLTLKNHQASDLSVDNMVGWIPPDGSTTSGQVINGGIEDDQLLGSIFGDEIAAGDGNDVVRGNAGNDVADGGGGNDTLTGGLGDDTVYGGDGSDRFQDITANEPTSFGNDRLYGGAGDDEFRDWVGKNRFIGEDGNDTFYLWRMGILHTGWNTATGGAGTDLFHVATSSASLLDVITDFQAGAGGDQLSVTGAFFHPGPRSFTDGYLRLLQSGSDTELQWDRDGAAGSQFGWVKLATLQGVTATAITSDNFLGEVIVGTPGNDDLSGGLGNDTVQGLAGNDTLDGSLGKDQLEGGFGDDLYFVDHLEDDVVEESNSLPGGLVAPGGGQGNAGTAGITDTVNAAINYTLGQYLEHLRLSGTAKFGTGNELANSITGNTRANLIAGNGGADTLNGGAGNDTLDGGAGSDRANGGAGDDVIVWGAGDKRLDGSTGTDTLKVTSGSLDLTSVGQTVIVNVEQVDLRGAAAGLVLTAQDVLDMSATDTVKVLGDEGDIVNAAGFTAAGAPVSGFQTYKNETSTLLVDLDITVI